MKFNLQLFAERDLANQTSNQLRKGIRSFKKRIEEHWAKIENPLNIAMIGIPMTMNIVKGLFGIGNMRFAILPGALMIELMN